MYPRNAASPERIAIGAVVQISDGAVQTSGVSIAVIPQGGASAAGGNSPTYDNGIVMYTPTQAETNYSSFIVIAYKTGCIPVSQTIVTSKSNTTGYIGLDWGQLLNAAATNDLSGTTVKTLTDAPADSSGTTTLLSRVSSARAGYLDNLSAGAVALEATLTAIKGATFNGATDSLEALRDRGDSAWTTATGFATSAALTTVEGKVDVIDAIVDEILVDTGTDIPATLATVAGYLDTEIAAIKAKTDNLPTDPADQSAVEAAIVAAWTTALTESYRANGATGTPAQLLYEILAHLAEASISGTTKTLKKLDHSTTAATLTLDDATTPTSITRAT